MSALDSSQDTSAAAVPAADTPSGVDIGRLVGVPIMAGLLVLNANTLWHSATRDQAWGAHRVSSVLGTVLSVGFYALLVSAFLRRSRSKATHPSPVAAVAALVATWLPFSIAFLPHGTPSLGLLVVADALLLVGLGSSIWAIRYLDRSFSMLAQARAVVRTGPYGLVRHPLYTGELVAFLGTVLIRPSGWAFAIWAVMIGLQVYRARNEETILAMTLDDYADYQRETPLIVPRALRRSRVR